MGCLQERLRLVPASSSRPKVHQLLDWAEGGMRACGRTRTSLKLVPETSKSTHVNITQTTASTMRYFGALLHLRNPHLDYKASGTTI